LARSRLRFSSGSATAVRRDMNARFPRAPLAAAISGGAPIPDLIAITAGASSDEVRRRLRELVDRYCDQSEAGQIVEQLALVFGLAERPEESTFVHNVQAGFVALMDGLARDHPLLLIFEDAHTLKAPMLDLIERLGTRSRRGPRRALVLALGRNELLEERPAWGSSSGNAVLVRLDPLSTEESIHLIRHAGGGHIDEARASEIARRADGNPYFIIETTGMLMPGGGGSPPSRVMLPPTVQAVVSARLDALPDRLRELARRASLFVYAFDLDELALVDGHATVEELRLLEDAEIVVRDEGSATPRWRLRHATLREVAYASLPKRERLRLHELVAEKLLESGQASWAAEHLELAALASLDLDPNDRTSAERAADALEAERARLVALLQREAGKTLEDAIAEVREAVDFCRYYASELRHALAPRKMPGPTGEANELTHRGRGVFVCISPWNFPLAIFVGQVSAALAAGNSVVAKPAEATSRTRTGFPPLCVSIVLLSSSAVRMSPTPRTTAACGPILTVLPPTLMLLLFSACSSCGSVSP